MFQSEILKCGCLTKVILLLAGSHTVTGPKRQIGLPHPQKPFLERRTEQQMPIKEGQNASFPKFDLDEYVSDDAMSDDEASIASKYRTKEDQDVAVFMAIADRLAMESYMHLLQGHVRCQLSSMDQMQSHFPDNEKEVVVAEKRFRWSEDKYHEVKCVFFEIDSYKDADMWWTDDEMSEMRLNAIDTVKHFRRHRKKYIKAVETIVTAPVEENTKANRHKTESAMKFVAKETHARGLEAHIVVLLSELRSETSNAVLEEQELGLREGLNYDEMANGIRERYRAFSQLSRSFAEKIGSCDHVEALKATMGRWVAEKPAPTSSHRRRRSKD